MNYLVVVAHPDDEVLGAGASIHKLIQQGNEVSVAIMVGSVEARTYISDSLSQDIQNAMDVLGVKKIYKTDFPNIKMNVIPHLDLVQFIERCIVESQAEIIITHHPSDTNNDHSLTSYACQAAARLFQRRTDVSALKELWYMEVPSSTEWSVDTSSQRFQPNMAVEVGKEGIETKIKALQAYKGVMRPYPHPRSSESIMGLAAFRGSQFGCRYAESFECVFRRII